ncbi:putative transposase, partial [Thermoactinomyces sp. DSM 45892]
PVDKESAIGIDLGLKHFAILTNGNKINAPKYINASKNILQEGLRLLAVGTTV